MYFTESNDQSCEMSILLHGANLLPEEKRVEYNSFGTKTEEN